MSCAVPPVPPLQLCGHWEQNVTKNLQQAGGDNMAAYNPLHDGGMAEELLTPIAQAALADRIREGDPAAEEELVRWFGPRIFHAALARIHDREGARDLAHDVLISVLRALRQGRLREEERLSAFIHGTLRNLANNYLRERGKRVFVALDPELPAPTLPCEFETGEQLGLVHHALESLQATERNVLLLTLVKDMKPGEIGKKLGLSPANVRTQKSRALKKVKELIGMLPRMSSPNH